MLLLLYSMQHDFVHSTELFLSLHSIAYSIAVNRAAAIEQKNRAFVWWNITTLLSKPVLEVYSHAIYLVVLYSISLCHHRV
jgi:hypothetical protein